MLNKIELKDFARILGWLGMFFTIPLICAVFVVFADRKELFNEVQNLANGIGELFCIALILVLSAKFVSDALLAFGDIKTSTTELIVWLYVNAAAIVLTLLAIGLWLRVHLERSQDLFIYVEVFLVIFNVTYISMWFNVLRLYKRNKADELLVNILP